jgi:hypothetical protein
MKFFSLLTLRVGCLVWLIAGHANAADFQHSYAVVVGIDDYSSVHKQHLSYARKDAEAVACYLKKQGYIVSELYDQRATKHNILTALHSVAVRLGAEDRVLVFMAGHGANEYIGDDVWGYFIPYDGTDTVSYVGYAELQDASRQMNNARHQLFIIDACFSGLMLKTRSGGVSPDIPNYLDEVTKRVAREALTAGGGTQEVLDTGPNGHSLFTSALLEGLGGAADLNRDGYITFAELQSYMVPRAWNAYQTPAAGVLPGHAGGDFVFRSPVGRTGPLPSTEAVPKNLVKRSDTNGRGAPQDYAQAPQSAQSSCATEPRVPNLLESVAKIVKPNEIKHIDTTELRYAPTFDLTQTADLWHWQEKRPQLTEYSSLVLRVTTEQHEQTVFLVFKCEHDQWQFKPDLSLAK